MDNQTETQDTSRDTRATTHDKTEQGNNETLHTANKQPERQKYRPPQRRVPCESASAAVSLPPTSQFVNPKRHPNARWVGASVLIFARAPDGYVYFLLGQERAYQGYKDSSKWSDFGGGAETAESEYVCAAREFLEETNRLVNPYPLIFKHSLPNVTDIVAELQRGNYVARIDFNFPSCRQPRTYTTFLLRIPWDPGIVDKFAKKTNFRQHGTQHQSEDKYTNFQGKLSVLRRGGQEKSALCFFSVPTLLQDVSKFNNSTTPLPGHTTVSENATKPSGRSRAEKMYSTDTCDDFDRSHTLAEFRPFFLARMSRILSMAFPNNVAHYLNLANESECRTLYQGNAAHIPLLKQQDTPGRCWDRGAKVPNYVSNASAQPPSRIFQNFNTHKKYFSSHKHGKGSNSSKKKRARPPEPHNRIFF